MSTSLPVFITYGFLYIAVITLWVYPRKHRLLAWSSSLALAVTFGLVSHQLNLVAIIPIIIFPIAVYYSQGKITFVPTRAIAKMIVVLLSIGLAAHLLPGFQNRTVLDHVYISKNAVPFTLQLEFDKALIGIFILGIGQQLITRKNEWRVLFQQMILKFFVVIFTVVILAYLLNFVRFNPKIPSSLLIWSITNLLFVCVAEEAFFRGFIQKHLSLILRKIVFGNYLAILAASLLFGFAHYPGGIKYIFLATVAGIGYGWVYDRSKRIEASILTHFGLNLTHFLLFTYPMLA